MSIGAYLEGPGNDHSSNTNAQFTTTSNTDKRQVLEGEHSVGISSDSSPVTFNTLDEGAIASALDLAKSSSQGAYDSLVSLVGLAQDVSGVEKDAAKHVQDAYSAAYQGAQDSASGVRTLATVGLVVIGAVIAFAWYAQKKG